MSRGYDFAKVSKWFAERSDLILLLFDAHKLDISDEFKGVMEELQPHEDKVRCVLNKADSLESTESLMRVCKFISCSYVSISVTWDCVCIVYYRWRTAMVYGQNIPRC